jgi:hypothetical protein
MKPPVAVAPSAVWPLQLYRAREWGPERLWPLTMPENMSRRVSQSPAIPGLTILAIGFCTGMQLWSKALASPGELRCNAR